MIDTMRRTTLAAALAGLLAAGCSSSGGTSARSAAGTRSTASATPSTMGSSGGRPADAATTRAVSTAFAQFFDSKTAPVDSQKFLQHGTAFGSVLEQQAQGSQAQHATAKVISVQLTSPDVASVRFTISSDGKALLPNVGGFAVRENGTWLVAAATFCQLLTLQGQAPAVCKDSSITALPS